MAGKRLKRHLGKYKIQALTPLQIEKFYAELLDHGQRNGKGLSPKTVKNTHVVLRKALADAERLGLVHRNAAAAARGPSVTRPEMTTWSSDQLTHRLNRTAACSVRNKRRGLRRSEHHGQRGYTTILLAISLTRTLSEPSFTVHDRIAFVR